MTPNSPVNPGMPVTELGNAAQVGQPEETPVLVHGKWTSMEEADKGVRELIGTLTARSQENDILKAKVAAYEQWVAENQTPPRPQGEDLFQRLSDAGVDPNLLLPVVQQFVHQELGPVTAGIQAQSAFEAAHPEFRQVQPEVAQFIGGNPNLTKRFNTMYQTDPYGAMEWAFDRYRETKASPQSAADNPMKAALPNQGPTSQQTINDANATRQQLNTALGYYQQYGDQTPLMDTLVKAGLRPWRG